MGKVKPLRCDPKLFEKDLSGQVVVVTGANSGIGLATSRQLIKQGAKVVLACRRPKAGEATAKELGENATFLQLDLNSLKSVRTFVDEFKGKFDRLDVLVNNAGIMACPYGKTEDGFESQFGCNHLAHFLLFLLLAPTLEATAEQSGNPSRFVALTSSAAECVPKNIGGDGEFSRIYFDDMNFEKAEYTPWRGYQQSKLANCLHAMEAAKRYDPSKIVSVSVHPGFVNTNLHTHIMPGGGGVIYKAMLWVATKVDPFALQPVDGAQASLHCILSDASALENGAYYAQTGPFKKKEFQNGGWPLDIKSSNPNVTAENATKLWDESVKLVGE